MDTTLILLKSFLALISMPGVIVFGYLFTRTKYPNASNEIDVAWLTLCVLIAWLVVRESL